MSISTTITHSSSQETSLYLHLHLPPPNMPEEQPFLVAQEKIRELLITIIDEPMAEKKVVLLLDFMQEESKGFPFPQCEEILASLANWKTTFLQINEEPLSFDFRRMKMAITMSWLYFNVVEFVMIHVAPNDIQKYIWLQCYSELKKQISLFLPVDRNIEDFLTTYQQRQKKKSYLEAIPTVRSLFQRVEEKLCIQANHINETLLANFKELQAELIIIQEESVEGAHRLNDRLDILTSKVTQLFQQLEESARALQVVGEQININAVALAGQLNQLLHVTHKC